MSTRNRDSAPAVLALVPSQGLGGGIEAYVAACFEALNECAQISAVSLLDGTSSSGGSGKIRFLLRSATSALRLRHAATPVIICFHPILLPAVLLCRLLCPRAPIRVVLYGRDIWNMSTLQRTLLARTASSLVTISDFSAGSLMNVRPSSILPPSLVRQRYEQLNRVGASRASRHCTPIRLLSVFRLADFVDKGGLTLIEAVTTLRNEGHVVDLTFAGSGKLPDLPGLTLPPWIKVVSSPSDATLAELYDESDIFVLATRLRARPHPYGEGFGIVLIEASLAGLPVIAPAGGGSHAALLDGITGLRPADDSPDALAAAIRTVFSTRHALGHNGHVWVAERFNPEAFGSAARRVLLDVGMLESPVGTLQLGYSGHGANTHEDPK